MLAELYNGWHLDSTDNAERPPIPSVWGSLGACDVYGGCALRPRGKLIAKHSCSVVIVREVAHVIQLHPERAQALVCASVVVVDKLAISRPDGVAL